MSRIREVIAFLVSPALPSLLVGVYLEYRTWGYAIPFSLFRIFDPALTAVSYAVAVMGGIPCYIWLRATLNDQWWRYSICGALLGCVPALVLLTYDLATGLGPGYSPMAFAFGISYGAVSGLAFWAITVPRNRAKDLV
jgi:hypothetical protein